MRHCAAGTMPGMLIHPQIDPVALQVGPLAVHWYGLTYLGAFGLFFALAMLRLKHEPFVSLGGPGGVVSGTVGDVVWRTLGGDGVSLYGVARVGVG